MPILHAPILEQAGFVKGALEPVINYVARLNGVDQYWQFDNPIQLEQGDVIDLDFVGGVGLSPYARFIGARDFTYSIDTGIDGSNFRLINTDVKLNGEAISESATPIPAQDVNNLSSVYLPSDPAQIHEIGALGGTRYLSLPLLNFRVTRNGAVINEIPLTNKDQGATQLPTVGNVNATMIGYTGDEWEEV